MEDKQSVRREEAETFYTAERSEWRAWLEANFESKPEIWLVYPNKDSGEKCISYNDAVEEALCFGWIDSTVRRLDDLHRAQRFTPRRRGSPYSRPNIERLIRLEAEGMLHPKVREAVLPLIRTPYVFPEDILEALRENETVWENYLELPEPYRRIRVAYIDDARKRPEEFRKRLDHFLKATRQGRRIRGFGGVGKYYD